MTRLGHVDIITRSEPPFGWSGVATHKGQLYLDSSTGRYYRAQSAGRSVIWDSLTFGSSDVEVIEDPEHPGFAKII